MTCDLEARPHVDLRSVTRPGNARIWQREEDHALPTTLTIRWDGDVAGLSEHALSLSAWLEPLGALLTAVRRTASGMENEALDDPDYGARGGRLAGRAKDIDLQLVAVRAGCAQLDFRCTWVPSAAQPSLFHEDLPERALSRVLDDISHEARGLIRSSVARKFLQSLPRGVRSQDYTLAVEGKEPLRVSVGEAQLADPPEPPISARRITGSIHAVTFRPGEPTITVKTAGDGQVTCAATEALVEQALALRAREVIAMVVFAKPARLIWLAASDSPPAVPDDAARTEQFAVRWSRTLERLAR